jgi:hypothetical protein
MDEEVERVGEEGGMNEQREGGKEERYEREIIKKKRELESEEKTEEEAPIQEFIALFTLLLQRFDYPGAEVSKFAFLSTPGSFCMSSSSCSI